MPPVVQECASKFDAAHRKTAGRAAKVLECLEADPTCRRHQQSFHRTLFEMRAYRLAVQPLRLTSSLADRGCLSPRYAPPQQLAGSCGGPWRLLERVVELDPAGTEKPPREQQPAWRLEESIWGPRKRRADSRDYYDTETTLSAMFNSDWAGALKGGALARMILRHDDDADAFKGGDMSEVEEVRAVLLEHALLLFNLFDYYASRGGEGSHIFSIGFNAYRSFVIECGLAEPGARTCSSTALDQLFVMLNAMPTPAADAAERRGGARGGMGGKGSKGDASGAVDFNSKHSLNRREFFTCLVHVAVMKFVQSGRLDDVSLAVEAVCALLGEKAPRECWQRADDFRRENCYVQETDAVLRRYEGPLRTIFQVYAAGDGLIGDSMAAVDAIGYDEWCRLVEDFRLVDEEFSPREATLCFVWSRLRVVDETSARSRARLTQLGFEDFLEVLVRVATMKATPSDSEVRAAGCEDGGQWLLQLSADPRAHAAFLRGRATSWDRQAAQPPWRCVEHIVTLLIRRAGGAAKGEPLRSADKPEAEAQDPELDHDAALLAALGGEPPLEPEEPPAAAPATAAHQMLLPAGPPLLLPRTKVELFRRSRQGVS